MAREAKETRHAEAREAEETRQAEAREAELAIISAETLCAAQKVRGTADRAGAEHPICGVAIGR